MNLVEIIYYLVLVETAMINLKVQIIELCTYQAQLPITFQL